jgi:DNA-binding CsgD family transcriptional regulator
MPRQHVSKVITEMVARLAVTGDVSVSDLIEGLDVDPAVFKRPYGALEWDGFAACMERLDELLGAKRFDEIAGVAPDVLPAVQGLLSFFISPRAMMRFVNLYFGPSSYPMLESFYEELEQSGQVVGHLKIKLRSGFASSPAFFRTMAPATASLARFAGHNPLPVRFQSGPRGGEYWFTFPKKESLRQRLKRALPLRAWRELLEQMEDDKQRLVDANEQLSRDKDAVFAAKLAEAKQRWSLTERQLTVLSGLARGLSNKALTEELECSVKTIETHVTVVLKRSKSESRLQLVARFWRDL